MGVSVRISGIRDPDGKLRKMLDLMESCDELSASYPPELVKYFEGTEALHMGSREDAETAATEVNLKYDLKIDGLVEGDVECGSGTVIDLSKLPPDIKKLRVSMS